MPPQPTDRELLARANRLLAEEGDPVGAAAIYERLAVRYPQEPRLLVSLGVSLIRSGRFAEARGHLERALERFPSADTYLHLARTHEHEGSVEEALRVLEEGLARHAGSPVLLAAKADALLLWGRAEEAWELVASAYGREAHPAVVLAVGKVSPHVGRAGFGIDALRAALGEDRMPGEMRARAYIELAHLLERTGAYEEAFRAARQGNELRPSRFDPEAFIAEVSRLIELWTPAQVARLARAGGDTSLPVFVVGMPRSGTSLSEQIIASHPEAHGGGELGIVPSLAEELGRRAAGPMERDEEGTRLAGRLSEKLMASLRALAPGARRVTDKLPSNCLMLGLIWQLAPGGRAIYCRRNPLDVCLSCYFQHFSPMHGYAGDLDHLAAFYAGCERIMTHWRRVLDYPVLEVVYEDLARDVEAGSRRIVEFVGLEWDEACARPHESERVVATASVHQVRRPVYTSSIGRGAKYGRLLDPLREALERYRRRLPGA